MTKQPKPLKEQELAGSVWWWRRTRFVCPRSTIDPNWHEVREWHDGLEQTAFEYELVRRACKQRELPSFIELDGWIQHNLHRCIRPPRKKPTRIDTSEMNPYGLSEADADGWRLNLRATDNQLLEHLRMSKLPTEAEMTAFLTGKIDVRKFERIMEARKAAASTKSQFLADINRQRAAQGITPPRGLKGQRNRRVSWRRVELLDIADFKIRRKLKDTDSERQARRQARLMGRRLLDRYLEVVEKLENSPRRPKEKVRPMPLLAREG